MPNAVSFNGALRLVWVTLILKCVDWIAKFHAVRWGDSVDLFFGALGEWLFDAMLVWLLYLALEPAAGGKVAGRPRGIAHFDWSRDRRRDLGRRGPDRHLASSPGYAGGSYELVGRRGSPALDGGQRHSNLRESLFIGLVFFFAIFALRQLLRNDKQPQLPRRYFLP